MSTSDDNCIPDELKDFVFDLHDSVRLSQIPGEQAALYGGKFREITAKVSEEVNFFPSLELVVLYIDLIISR